MNTKFKACALAAIAVVALGLTGCGSSSDTTTATEPPADSATAAAPDEAGTPIAVEAGDNGDGTQYLTSSVASVKAGSVTFTLTNAGIIDHEMVVLKTDTPYDQLEVDGRSRVSEDDSVGEIGEIKPGETGTITLDLEPGNYVLVCNIATHYAMGMRTALVVE